MILLAGALSWPCAAQSTQPAIFVVNNSAADSGITSFTINGDGTLNFVQEIHPAGSLNPQAIDVSPNGRWLVVGHGTSNTVTEQLTFLQVHADATMSIVLETTTPDSPVTVIWLDDEHVAVTAMSSNPDKVIVYRFSAPPAVPSITTVSEAALGSSTFYIAYDREHRLLYPRATSSSVWPMRVNADFSLTKLTQTAVPTGIFFIGPGLTPDGTKLYFGGGISNDSDFIGGFDVDTTTGALTPMADSPFFSPSPPDTSDPSPKEVVVSLDGQFAFVNHGTSGHVQGFTIDQRNGMLTAIPGAYYDVGGQGDSGPMAIFGDYLFVLRRYSSTTYGPSGVITLAINSDGTLTPVGGTFSTQGGLPWEMVAWPGVQVDCPADVNHSGEVDVDDLIAVILGWGPCTPPPPCVGDVNGNGGVDVDDLIAVILAWGPCD
jgi:6-phosphogluconolactonase (cycloisomerase 2 family)